MGSGNELEWMDRLIGIVFNYITVGKYLNSLLTGSVSLTRAFVVTMT